MNILKPALIVAVIVASSPALAGGVPAFPYLPNLTFPSQAEPVTKADTPAVGSLAAKCTVLERSIGVPPNTCGTLSRDELVKRKLAHDD